MKTKFKSKLLSILLVLVMVLSIVPFGSLTAFAAPTLSGNGGDAWNIQLSDEGVLTWNAMGSATYDIQVDKTTSGGTVTKIQGISGTSYNLINRFKELKIENGTYYFYIKANDTYTNSGFISFRYVSPEAKLSEPQNLRWDGTVAKWDSVANATEYEVKIYSNSGYCQRTKTTTETQYDWTTEAEAGGWFEVVATGDNYRNSNAAESPKYGSYSWSAPSLSGGDAAWNVQLSDEGVLTWNDMGSATYDIRVDKTATGGTVTNIQDVTGTSYNLINRFKELKIENGTYYFQIKANDTETTSGVISFRYVSPEAKLSEPQNLRWDGTVAKWDSVANATEYEVKIYSNSGYCQQTKTTTETQYDWTTEAEAGGWFEVVATGDNYRNSNAAESPLYVPVEISELSATVTAPVGGEHPSFTVTVPDGAHYTATVYAWYDLNNNGAQLTNSDTFVTGNEYQARIHFTANTGYEINSASYTINGTPNYAAFDTAEQRGMNFVATAPAVIVITAANATVTVPVAGEHPDFNPISGDSSRYTVAFETWYSHEPPYPDLDANSVFEHGKSYSLRIRFTPNAGYQFDSNTVFTVNGEVTASFGGIGEREYSATAYAATYTVTYDANGGTGSMADVTGVSGEYVLSDCGFTAPNGKQFKGWATSANGSVIEGTTYNVTANVEFFAIWEDIPVTNYTINATAGANGSISPSGEVTVAEGEDKTFIITANSGYHIKDVKVNGSSVGTAATYTFNDVAANATITVEFEVDTVPHVCNPTLVPEDEPDCITAGKSAYYHCECGKNYEDAQGNTEIDNLETWGILNALGHDPSTAWSTDGEYHWKECTRCAGQQLEKAAHTDTDTNGKCDVCEYQMSTTPNTPDNPNNTPDNPDNTPDDPDDDKDGLGAGAIVAIVIGSVAVVGVGGFALFWFVIKKKTWAEFIALFKKH